MQKNIIHFSHANGFPGSTYKQLLTMLEPQYDVHYIDIVGMDKKYPVTNNWNLLVDQLINYIHNNYTQPIIGLGHSLGGLISLFAANRQPQLFKKVIMLDSPIIHPFKAWIFKQLKGYGLSHYVTPGGKGIITRRQEWANKKTAYQYFKTRRSFANFNDDCLQDIVNFGTIANPSGGRTLKIPPLLEAKIFKTFPDNYHELKSNVVPTHAIIGQESDFVGKCDRHIMCKNYNVQLHSTPGGHFFPFEFPKQTANKILQIAGHSNKRS